MFKSIYTKESKSIKNINNIIHDELKEFFKELIDISFSTMSRVS